MKTIELKIVGRGIGYNRDGEPNAEKRLALLQESVEQWIKSFPANSRIVTEMQTALMDSKLDEESNQGSDDVEWRLLIDGEDDDLSINLRTASQPSLASGNHIRLTRDNAEVFPDIVPTIEVTVL